MKTTSEATKMNEYRIISRVDFPGENLPKAIITAVNSAGGFTKYMEINGILFRIF